MPKPENYSFTRYLEAKQSVDDRAINQHVWQTFLKQIKGIKKTIQVLELGGGIGTMLTRLLQHHAFDHAHYTILDQDPDNFKRAPDYLKSWAMQNNWKFDQLEQNKLILQNKNHEIHVHLILADMHVFLAQDIQKWDAVIAHAFLDLFDVQTTIPAIFQRMTEESYFYFSINYDGLTIFEPVLDIAFENEIMVLYNQTMDQRVIDGEISGDSQSGRHLFTNLQNNHAHILAAGASDWLVFPQHGKYIQDEAYFLHHILSFFESSLSKNSTLDQQKFKTWLDTRHQQIDEGMLVYIAHQLDFIGKPNKILS